MKVKLEIRLDRLPKPICAQTKFADRWKIVFSESHTGISGGWE